MSEQAPAIHAAIIAIMGEVGHIAKHRQNPQQHYNFRGIDDMYAAVQPLLVTHGVYIRTVVQSSEQTERQTKSGGTLIYTKMIVDHIWTAVDGSSVTVTTAGESMDSGDKSSNKAMSAAMKYAIIQTLAIPTEGDNDSENSSPEPKPSRATSSVPLKPPAASHLPTTTAAPVNRQPPPSPPAQQFTPPSQQRQHGEGIYLDRESWWTKDGNNANGPWTLTKFKDLDGNQYSTFDATFASIAGEAAEAESPVLIQWLANSQYPDTRDIKDLTHATAQAAEPAVQPAELQTGAEEEVQATIQSVTQTAENTWRVDTDQGRFGITDGTVAETAKANVNECVVVFFVVTPRGRLVTRIEDIPF